MDYFAAALTGVPGVGARRLRALLTCFQSAEQVWRATEKRAVRITYPAGISDTEVNLLPEKDGYSKDSGGYEEGGGTVRNLF